MKILEWVKFLEEMKLRNKTVYTLAEIANIGNTAIKNAKTISQRLKKKGVLTNIHKNIWAVQGADIISIASMFTRDCYFGMESALFRYNMIKQSPQVYHFINTLISGKKKTKFGVIQFHKINSRLYFGHKDNIAEPEKALLDYLYFCLKDGRKPFTDCDIAGLRDLNREKLSEYGKSYPKSVRKYLGRLLQSKR